MVSHMSPLNQTLRQSAASLPVNHNNQTAFLQAMQPSRTPRTVAYL
jgi:hypothetical protein